MHTYINDMLALIPLLVIGTGTVRELAYVYVVDIPRRTSHVDRFFRTFLCARAGAVDDEHPTMLD